MKNAICFRVYDEFDYLRIALKQSAKLLSEFDQYIFCNLETDNLREILDDNQINCNNIIHVPVLDYPVTNIAKTSDRYKKQVGSIYLLSAFTEYMSKLDYDYVLSIEADEIPYNNNILKYIPLMDEYDIIALDYICGFWPTGLFNNKYNWFRDVKEILSNYQRNTETTCRWAVERFSPRILLKNMPAKVGEMADFGFYNRPNFKNKELNDRFLL